MPKSIPIAVVGASCRFPGGVSNLNQYWSLLVNNIDGISQIPSKRWNVERFSHKLRKVPGRSCTQSGGIIENIDHFDNDFFGISPKEAEYMDPQQRLMLELVWEALEDAQIRPSTVSGSNTPVYLGASSFDSSLSRADDACVIGPYSMIGTALSIIANRISYIFNLHGPSLVIDTACSSSLVAIHHACNSLKTGNSQLAFAGGVNLLYSPFPYIGFSKAHMLSKDGRCKVFDAHGNGYVRAEGAGIIILKPLDLAIKDGNRIHAVIVKSGVNSDGRTTGLALPNQKSQIALLNDIYNLSKSDLKRIAYIEAHGTGTAVGDPIETGAIGHVLSKVRNKNNPLPIGSVKSNIGHLEPASGMAGLLKTILVLKNKEIPANLHINELNPSIDFSGMNLLPVTRNMKLPEAREPVMAGVNSFGFGGTNAHLLIQEPPKNRNKNLSPEIQLNELPPLFISARSEVSLKKLASSYSKLIQARSEDGYYNIAHCAAYGRDHLRHRMLVHGRSPEDIAQRLEKFACDNEADQEMLISGEAVAEKVKTSFVFSGNGSQWPGMGQKLMNSNSTFLQSILKADDFLADRLGWSLRVELEKPVEEQRLHLTEVAQPLLFVIQVGLVDALREKGIIPSCVYGHSVGEVAAAYASQALSLEQACQVIYHRSHLQGKTYGQGKMAAVNISPEDFQLLPECVSGEIELGAVNSPKSITITGQKDALVNLEEQMTKQGIFFRILDLEYPFHSRFMNPLQKSLSSALKDLKPSKGKVEYISTVTGELMNGTDLGSEYWWQNVRQPVKFGQATNTALEKGIRLFIEIGPHGVLQYYINDCIRHKNTSARTLPTLKRKEDDAQMFHNAWRKSYISGCNLEMETFFKRPARYTELPGYPWDKSECKVAPTLESLNYISGQQNNHRLLGYRHKNNLLWENEIDSTSHPFLADHNISMQPIFPAAGYVETIIAAAYTVHKREYQEMENIGFLAPMFLNKEQPKTTRLTVSSEDGYFRYESKTLLSDDSWTLHCSGKITAKCEPYASTVCYFIQNPDSFGRELDVSSIYKSAQEMGLNYGPAFRPLKKVWLNDNEILAQLESKGDKFSKNMYLNPVLIDGAFQSMLALMDEKMQSRSKSMFLPTWISRIKMMQKGCICYSHAKLEKVSPRSISATITLMDEQGLPLAIMEGCRFTQVQGLEKLKKKNIKFIVTSVPVRHPQDTTPSPFPELSKITSQLKSSITEMKAQLNREIYYQEIIPLCRAALLSRIHEFIRMLTRSKSKFALDKIFAEKKLKPEHMFYVRYAMDFLASSGMAEEQDGVWHLIEGNELPPAVDLWKTIVSDYPSYLPEAVIIGRIGLHLLDIFRGKKSSDDILSMEVNGAVESYYTNAPSSRLLNSTMLQVFRILFESTPVGRQLRILEIGAGPGGLLTHLLPLLPERRFEYHATDTNENMVEYIKSKWEDRAEIKFHKLDIENVDSDFFDDLGKFDVVVAGHIFSEIDNLDHALSNCRQFLSPGGMLLLAEFLPTPEICLTLGISPRFWSLSPDKDKPAPRLLSHQGWHDVIQEAGFSNIQTLMETNVQDPDCLVLMAENPEHSAKSDTPNPSLQEQKTWLLLVDSQPSEPEKVITDKIKARLDKARLKVVLISAEPGCSWSDSNPATIDPFSDAQWHSALDFYSKDNSSLELINLMGFDPDQNISTDRFKYLQSLKTTGTAMLGKALAASKISSRMWLISAGAMSFKGADSRPVPSQSAVWGLARVLTNELPDLDIRLLDIHGQSPEPASIDSIVRELFAPSNDKEIIICGAQRYSPRLISITDDIKNGSNNKEIGAHISLNFDSPGKLNQLYWTQIPHRLPGLDQVTIKTKSTSLNFRDVMFTLGYLPEEALEDGFAGPTLGLECSGEVVAVGEGVENVSIGDEVVALSGSCFDSHVIAHKNAVFPKPEQWSHEEAATIPVAFFTAYYALKYLADIQPGEKLLIHGGAGGVGLAAIQVANHLGAEVFATAGAPEKRDFLTLLGVPHVLNSRSLDFENQIKTATKGQGVDAVLNCLAGEALTKSLSLLKPFGRFLELGKRDFYANSPLRMRLLRKNITFHGIDVDQLMTFRPQVGRKLFLEIIDLCSKGIFSPLVHSVYQRSATVEAFRTMQRARHIGKIVISYDENRFGVKGIPSVHKPIKIDPQGTYLITGGMSGLGLAAAKWLADKGATSLILMGRTGASTPDRKKALEDLINKGINVRVVKSDIANIRSLKQGLSLALKEMPSLKGVIHCAAQLHDALITNQTTETFEKVLNAKAVGAWNLHLATTSMSLDFFILFSSMTTIFGNPGQSNYVAANMMLENLAVYRRSQGLPCLTIAWGPVSDTGILTRNPSLLAAMQKQTGILPLSTAQILEYMEQLLCKDYPAVSVFNLDWDKLSRLPISGSSFFNLLPQVVKNRSQGPSGNEIQDTLKKISSQEAVILLTDIIREELSPILRVPATKIKHDVSVTELGMDSLMGVELGLALEKRFELNSGTSFTLGQETTVQNIAATIYKKLVFGDTYADSQTDEVLANMKQHGVKGSTNQAKELLNLVDNDLEQNKKRILNDHREK